MSAGRDLAKSLAEAPAAIGDDWAWMRAHTPARIALGRTGVSLPTREVLALGLAHAHARDAVFSGFDTVRLTEDLETLGYAAITVGSRAEGRAAYIVNPDLGRRLSADDLPLLSAADACDVVFVIGDGLSPLAVQSHAVPILQALAPSLAGLKIGPVVLARQARVALSDEIGALLSAKVAVMLIGERPGLSSHDSVGIYLTYGPKVGNTDEARNCISNIRPGGLSFADAALEFNRILTAAIATKRSGVALAVADQPPIDEVVADASVG